MASIRKKPIPAATRRGSPLPWRALDVGECFFLSPRTRSYKAVAVQVSGWTRRCAPKRFTYRTLDDGYWVWRVR